VVRLDVVGSADSHCPGWIRVRLLDAAGRAWFLVEKVPVLLGRLDVDLGGHGVHSRSGVWAEDGTFEFVVRRWLGRT
jgi:hypothetical protein